ncbi:hypothetical protein LOD99_2805 [Oopsacas minuta]|uniref:START domain-containing protein n=1 Tax=Oopsacas minuta TaxID=111878 RepID=A0AAV7K3S4_9METZ|nr:hypothetical protein LOD99_2805 [Oopsacas minuta]
MEHSLSSTIHPLTDKDIDYFKYLTDNTSGWEESFDSNGVSINTRNFVGTNIRMLRASSVFAGISPAIVYDYIQDTEYRSLHNSITYNSYTVCYIDDFNSIEYLCIKCVYPLYDRDIVMQKTCIPSPDDYVIIYHSVEDELAELDPTKVRAHTYITGYRLIPVPEGTLLTFLSHSDPKGYIPSFICNLVAKKSAPNTIASMCKESLSYLEWKESNNPLKMPWRKVEYRDKSLYASYSSIVKWGFTSSAICSSY